MAFFNGGGWVEPLSWDDYDADGHAQWEAMAERIGRNLRAADAAPELLEALRTLTGCCEVAAVMPQALGRHYEWHLVSPELEAARKAIAQATGGDQ